MSGMVGVWIEGWWNNGNSLGVRGGFGFWALLDPCGLLASGEGVKLSNSMRF